MVVLPRSFLRKIVWGRDKAGKRGQAASAARAVFIKTKEAGLLRAQVGGSGKMRAVETLVCSLLVIAAVLQATESQFCSVSGCLGCGGDFIICNSAGLSSFPRELSLVDQQNAKEL